MKIKDGFLLCTVAGEHVVVAVDKASVLLNGIIKLNDSGVKLWNLLMDGADINGLASCLTEEYGISTETAVADATKFTDTLRKAKCLEE